MSLPDADEMVFGYFTKRNGEYRTILQAPAQASELEVAEILKAARKACEFYRKSGSEVAAAGAEALAAF